MGDRIQIVAVGGSLLLLGVVLELVRRRRLAEEYSVLWVVSSLALLLLSIRRELLHAVARQLGVHYPPVLLLLALIVIVFFAALWFTVIVSRQKRQIERLTEETSILSAELRELRAQRSSSERVDGEPLSLVSQAHHPPNRPRR